VAREAPDIAVGLGRLVEALQSLSIDADADAEERHAIDENSMLAP